jgi:hypothetical protein
MMILHALRGHSDFCWQQQADAGFSLRPFSATIALLISSPNGSRL